MADINVLLMDDQGNKYYIQTTTENIFLPDNTTLQNFLESLPRIHSGTTEPSPSLAKDGDLYIKIEE